MALGQQEYAIFLHSFSRRLVGARNAAKLSQSALASAVGVGLRTIQYLEEGKRRPPTQEKLAALSTVLNVSVPYLLGLDESGRHQSSARFDPKELDLLKTLETLSSEDRDELIEVLKCLASLKRRRARNKTPEPEMPEAVRRAVKAARDGGS